MSAARHEIDENCVFSLSVDSKMRQEFSLNFSNTPMQVMTPDLQMGQLLSVFEKLQPADSVWRRCHRALRRFRLARVSLEPTRYSKTLHRSTKTIVERSIRAEDAESFALFKDTSVRFDDLAFGDAVVFYGYRQVASLDTGGVAVPTFTLLAVVPWFFDAQFYQSKREIRWDHTIVNTTVDRLAKHISDALKRIEAPVPFLPIVDSTNANDDAVDDGRKTQLLSFALRWHQKRHAPPKAMLSSNNNNNNNDAAELWRNKELANVLEARSFVFFATESPRMALFAKTSGWDVIIETLRSFVDMKSASFVMSQLCDVLRFVIRTEYDWRGELAMHNFVKSFLQQLSVGISNSELDQLRIEQKKARQVESLLKTVQQTTAADSQIALAECRAFVFTVDHAQQQRFNEQLNLQLHVGKQLLESQLLSVDELYYIAAPLNVTQDSSGSCVHEETTYESLADDVKSFIVKDAVVLSYNFGVGSEILADAFIEHSVGKQSMNASSVVRKGVVYVGRATLIDCCVNLFQKFLLQHALGPSDERRRKAKQSDLETRFLGALPKNNNVYYSNDNRTAEFDDIALGSEEHRVVMLPATDRATMADFVARKNNIVSLPLPVDFSAPTFLGLTRSDAELVKMKRVAYSLHSKKNGAIEIDRAALVAVAHVSDCHGGGARRAHLVIEYDVDRRAEVADSILQQSSGTDDAKKALEAFDDLVSSKKCCTGGSENIFPGIEDLVRNLYDNRALPLCMRQYAETVFERHEHLKYEERIIMYRMLMSLRLPELTHQHVMRFLMQYTPRGTLHSQFMESKTYREMLEKRHRDSRKGYIAAKLKHGSANVDEDGADAATTVAQSCHTMQNSTRRQHCPFASITSKPLLRALVQRSGVENADTIGDIVDSAVDRGHYGVACRNQMHMSRPIETRSVPFYQDSTADCYPRHPYHAVYLAADHLLRFRERRQRATTLSSSSSSLPTTASTSTTNLDNKPISHSMLIDNEDSMYIDHEFDQVVHVSSSQE